MFNKYLNRELRPSNFTVPLSNNDFGLLETTPESEEQFNELMASGISISTLGIGTGAENKATDARVLKCDDDFLHALTAAGKYNEALWMPKAGKPTCCSWHWIVGEVDNEPQFVANRLVISQQSTPSCAGCSATMAAQLPKLSRRAFGLQSDYTSMSRIATWFASKGDSMRSGQTLSYMAEYMCYMGMFPESLVGTSVTDPPVKYKEYRNEAKEFQSYIAAIPFNSIDFVVDVMFMAAKAGYGIQIGSTKWPTSKTANSSMGVARPGWGGGGGHATCCIDWRPATVNTQTGSKFPEAIFFVNSHGDKYTGKSENKEPRYGCWLTREDCKIFLQTAKGFGSLVIYLPEITLLISAGSLKLALDSMYRYVVPEPIVIAV